MGKLLISAGVGLGFFAVVLTPILLSLTSFKNTILPPLETLNKEIADVEKFVFPEYRKIDNLLGAESYAQCPFTGDIYTGLANGSLAVLCEDLDCFNATINLGETLKECGRPGWEKKCGRPLGLAFHPLKENELFVCALSGPKPGLLKVNTSTAHIETLASLEFCNSVAVDSEGINIYFTQSTSRFDSNILKTLSQRPFTGSLQYLNLGNQSEPRRVLLDQLAYPNGVLLSEDEDGEDVLYVAETLKARILRVTYDESRGVWKSAVFKDLPFLPDNLKWTPVYDSFIVAGPIRRSRYVDLLITHPLASGILHWLPGFLFDIFVRLFLKPSESVIAEISLTGEILSFYSPPEGTPMPRAVSEGFVPTGRPVLLVGSFDFRTEGSVFSAPYDFSEPTDYDEAIDQLTDIPESRYQYMKEKLQFTDPEELEDLEEEFESYLADKDILQREQEEERKDRGEEL